MLVPYIAYHLQEAQVNVEKDIVNVTPLFQACHIAGVDRQRSADFRRPNQDADTGKSFAIIYVPREREHCVSCASLNSDNRLKL